MPSTRPATDAARLDKLEEQLEDLAGFVGRLTASVFGDEYTDYIDPSRLVWKTLAEDPDFGWWTYVGTAVETPEEASADA